MCELQDRESYWKMMHKYIGSDITSMVTLPVIIFEPMTMLQMMAEVNAFSMFAEGGSHSGLFENGLTAGLSF
jgi:hypothetical protein